MNWSPWAGTPDNYSLSIAALVANGTMDASIAGTLWAAADEQLSFLTVAMPRGAGKTTVASSILALRRPEVPLNFAFGEPAELEALRREQRGGYLVIGEFSPYGMPSYIWGSAARDVFRTLHHGYSLQTSLHATGVDPAIRVVTREIGVSDEDASRLKLVVYIEALRGASGEVLRRVSEVFEVDGVQDGRPIGRTLHRWRRDADVFERVSEPAGFAADRDVLQVRREAIDALAKDGRTSVDDVATLRATFLQ